MERVTGIGGFFFRAADPARLGRWYAEHLGVDPPPESYDDPSWWQQGGPTVLAPMTADSPHFGRPEQSWSINFRVDDLDAMVTQLRAAGVDVAVEADRYPNGRFANLADPDGNPIQLWEPAGVDARGHRPGRGHR
ncbi:MAG: VOC family protein [Geodermatophilaceae bacterium]|nr:VOC family protein [Geodermatophilaceae bacterium]